MTNRVINRRSAALALAGLAIGLWATHAQAEMNEIGKKLMAAVPPHGDKTLGDPKAPVVMVEYASATCPHCAEFHNTVWPEIKKDYVDTGKVFFVFREMPNDGLALGAFMLMRCLPDDKYFAGIEQMFREQDIWMKGEPKVELLKIAAGFGLDQAGAEACLKNEAMAKAMNETRQRAYKEFRVKSTPSFFINGFFSDGHEDPKQVRALIDRMLAGAE
jgi:protein-disulfide isomerase